MSKINKAVNIFLSYATEDRKYVIELRKHLFSIERSNKINVSSIDQIVAGTTITEEVSKMINQAELILIFVSSNYLTSDFLYDHELVTAIKKHEENEALVIPIIIQPCFWQGTPLGNLQALPRNNQPISEFSNRDGAYYDIARGIVTVIDSLFAKKSQKSVKDTSENNKVEKIFNIEDIFISSGIPTITFVEPKDFRYIKSSILQKGRGVIIEGPSGIGKTTIVVKVLESLKRKFELLTARRKIHVERLKSIVDWHNGIVVIDDFHILPIQIKNNIVNYLKYIADYDTRNRKIVIIGIPNTGDSLIRMSFDLANRITIFKLGNSDSDKIQELITKGEKALNIDFLEKQSIIRESFGSLYIAQMLCAYIAIHNNIERTQQTKTLISVGLLDVIHRIIQDLAPKFNDTVRYFAAIGGRKDRTCIELLKEMAATKDGVLNLLYLIDKKPELKLGINRIRQNQLIQHFFNENEKCKRHLIFDERASALIIDDPQFKFYLNNTSVEKLATLVGKLSTSVRDKVFISYSHNDEKWLKKVLTHLKHLEREGIIDLWVDKRIKAGQNWRQEINNALSHAKIAILLISQDFIASDFIVYNELPPLLAAAENEEAKILQLVLKPCSIKRYKELTKFQMVNDPKKPLIALSEYEQDTLLVELAETIEEALKEEII